MSERNVVICSDGTGNTFDRSVSNVTRLVKLLALNDRKQQVVVYDQGIGTVERLESVRQFQRSIQDPDSLDILDAPKGWSTDPGSLTKRLLGLSFGYGLKANIRQMYEKLSQCYRTGDKLFFFGFSRGAFTVRALAGLIYHCGLPKPKGAMAKDCFAEAYTRYSMLYEQRGDEWERITAIADERKRGAELEKWYDKDKARFKYDAERVAEFQRRFPVNENVRIHFLGLWDTVKSYGGIRPIMLPHLRHNPCVRTVRHALALNERRSWFDATTWGRLDLDKKGALVRLKETLSSGDYHALEAQDIEEVWFRGCHSDIGGGDAEAVTGMIALRWMLGEAKSKGLVLNQNGEIVLGTDDPPGPAEIHESMSPAWKAAAYAHLKEIDNSGMYPILKSAVGKTGRRTPDMLTRDGKILLHSSVGAHHAILTPVEYRQTKR